MRPLLVLLLGLLAGCAAPRPAEPAARPSPRPAPAEPPAPSVPPAEDVRLGGLSLVGTWAAIEVVGDAQATADLDRGLLEQTLVIRPQGHAVLTGVDARASGEPQAFGGTVAGDRIALTGLSGVARLSVQGRRLLLHDPRGRTTVFVRVGR